MLTFRRLITFVVPSSILGLSWFWWRWKNKTTKSIEDMKSVDEKSVMETAVKQDIPENNCTIDKINADKLFISKDLVLEEKIEALVIEEQTNMNENTHTYIVTSFQEPITLNKQESKRSEDESGIDVDDDLSNEDNSSVVNSIENEASFVDLPCDKEPISQLSVECIEEDIVCEDLSPVQYNAPPTKRNRNRSSCGDSAICDDYSSDALSMTGSDSAVKSSESEACTSESQPEVSLTEEQRVKKFQQDARTYRDWYGSSICSNDIKERPDKPRHWGSLPVSDTDSDSECILKRTAKIGSVSLHKLSIELNEELTKLKSPYERNSSKSSRFNTPKQPRRRNRKSESRTPKKSPVKQSSHPKKSESRRSRKRSSATPKKDLDKSWRNLDSGKKPEKIVVDPYAKRVTIEYEFPDDMCGRLIGKSGRHISEFKESTGVDICIECELHGKNRIVSMTGVLSQIQNAEKQLNEKFNDSLLLVSHPDISEAEKEVSVIIFPEDTEFNVVVTAIIDVANFYVQMCNHDVEEKLMQLQTDLYGCYVSPRQKYLFKDNDLPKVDEYCVSFVDNLWCRLKVLEVDPETRMIDAFFIDYGGNVNLSVDIVWKIRPDLLQIPAQASLCCLNAAPVADATEFLYEANELFYQLVGAKALQASVLTYNGDVPFVQLSYFDEERGEIFSVLEQMQAWGLVQDESIPAQLSESSLDDESVQTDSSRDDYMQQLHDDGVQLVDSLLNCSAPQFVYAS